MLLPMRLCSGRCEGVRAVVAQPRLCERRGGCSAWCAVLDVRYEAAVFCVDIGLYEGLPVLLSPQSASVARLSFAPSHRPMMIGPGREIALC
jgi:hypothetical protein